MTEQDIGTEMCLHTLTEERADGMTVCLNCHAEFLTPPPGVLVFQNKKEEKKEPQRRE